MHPFGTLKPLISRARPRLGLPNTFWEASDRSWQLSPAVDALSPPAIFEELDLAKVTGVFPGETIGGQVARMRGGPGRHKATVAYEIRGAVISRGNLYSKKVALPLSGMKSSLWAPCPEHHFQEGALASSAYGIRFFGHWMLDDLPKTLAARELAEPISLLSHPTASQTGFMRLLGLSPVVVTHASFDRIIVLDDVGQNEHKRARYEALRLLGRRGIERDHPGTMLLRGSSGIRRVLLNEPKVAELALSRGLKVMDPSKHTAEEVIEACTGAQIILGVEGSQLSNGMLWMARKGAVVVIQPPQRFVAVLKDACDCIGLNYAFIVGDPVDETDFTVDLNALSKLLDRVESLATL